MTDRPLWRVGTKTLAQELKRRGKETEATAVLIAMLQDAEHYDLAKVVARRAAGETVAIAVVAPAIVRHPFEAMDEDEEEELDQNIVLKFPPKRSFEIEVDVIAIHEDAPELGGAQDGVPEVNAPRTETSWGSLADLGTAPSAEDIADMRRSTPLGKRWPPMADEDAPLPFEVDRDE